MPEFLLGMVLGGLLGVLIVGLCVSAARGDEP